MPRNAQCICSTAVTAHACAFGLLLPRGVGLGGAVAVRLACLRYLCVFLDAGVLFVGVRVYLHTQRDAQAGPEFSFSGENIGEALYREAVSSNCTQPLNYMLHGPCQTGIAPTRYGWPLHETPHHSDVPQHLPQRRTPRAFRVRERPVRAKMVATLQLQDLDARPAAVRAQPA